MHIIEKKLSYLIIGGAGFVGSNLIKKLIQYDTGQIVCVDNLLSSEKENLQENQSINFIKGSIANKGVLDQIRDEYDFIFHLATFHGNQNSIFDPISDHENNMLTTLKLFNHVKNFKRIKKIVYSGAGCAVAKKTWDDTEATNEDAPLDIQMDSPYSISKIIGEFYSVYFYNHYKLPIVRARFQNVYGPGEILGAGKWRGTPATVWRNVVPTFIYKALNGESLPLENEGLSSRDFIFVDDIVNGLILCALNGDPGDVYNLATGKEILIKDLANTINTLTGNHTPHLLLPRRVWDNSGRRYGSTEKSLQKLKFEAITSIDEGLRNTVEWTKSNIDFINKNIKKHSRYLNQKSK
ncbi:MAG: hypothetical protein ACD_79C00252G0007 [uncultured bacterium]|nr:MAG: hypothetical protein ACD_79C00252G0007 [uncultured bacterium]